MKAKSLTFIKQHLVDLILLLLTILFFVLPGDFVPQFTNDSIGYIDKLILRSPLYPLWLSLFRCFFSEDFYLTAVIIGQTILAIFSVTALGMTIRKLFTVKPLLYCILYPFLLFPYGIELLTSDTPLLYQRTILTEGLSYSLFYLYLIFFLTALCRNHAKALLGSYLCSAILILLRGQMQLTLIFSVLLSIYLLFSMRKFKKQFLSLLGSMLCGIILLLVITKSITFVYSQHVFGEPVKPEFTNTSYMINFLYTADDLDRSLFDNHPESEFINLIFDDLESSGYVYANRGTTLSDRRNHLMDANLYLKLHSYIPLANSYYGSDPSFSDADIYNTYESVAHDLLIALAPRHFGQWLSGFFSLFFYGTCEAVFFLYPPLKTLCYVYAYVVYFAALFLSVYRLKKAHDSIAARFMLCTLIMLTGNLAACCITIGSTGRYLSYFWGLFYIAGLLLLAELFHSQTRYKAS